MANNIDYIRAQLDLLKMAMAALFSTILLILWTTIQYFHIWETSIYNEARIITVILGIFLFGVLKLYLKIMNELKYKNMEEINQDSSAGNIEFLKKLEVKIDENFGNVLI